MTEHDLQNLIRLELTELGWLTFRINVGKVKMIDGRWFDTGLPPGFTDLIALKNGQTVFIEVKAKNGKPSQKQIDFINLVKKCGFVAGIVYSIEDARRLINA
jgi:N-acyl-D-aspartate/D-glutamate deacylase